MPDPKVPQAPSLSTGNVRCQLSAEAGRDYIRGEQSFQWEDGSWPWTYLKSVKPGRGAAAAGPPVHEW